MQYSVNSETLKNELNADICKLLNCDSFEVLDKAGGGNSLVFCVKANERKVALKFYPPFAPGKRDRLKAEVTVYQFLNENNVSSVPMLYAFDYEKRLLAIEWIDGEVPASYQDSDVMQAVAFLRQVAGLTKLPASKMIDKAAEACLSLTTILNQIQARYERLVENCEDEPELIAFLKNKFLPTFTTKAELAKVGYQAAKLDPDCFLSIPKRSLIPADFGFHNAIRDTSSSLYFFDFDYFGWDDPVKLLADILWHPRMTLTAAQKQEFINGIADIYAEDETFMPRFTATLPLFGLRWALILLNEFLPEFWQNRQHANVHADHETAKQHQLKLANELLDDVQTIGTAHENITATSI